MGQRTVGDAVGRRRVRGSGCVFPRAALIDHMKGHVLAWGELVGTYERKWRTTACEACSVLSGLGDSCLDQFTDEGRGQRLVRTEMKGALGLTVALEIPCESLQRRSTEGVVGTTLRRGLESGDDPSVEAKRRHPITDALLGSGNDGSDRLPKRIERGALVAGDSGEVVVGLRHA